MIPFRKQAMTPDIRKRFAKTKYPREVIFRLLDDLKPDDMLGIPVDEVPYNTMRSRVYDFNHKRKKSEGDKRWLSTTKVREDGKEITVVGCGVLGE